MQLINCLEIREQLLKEAKEEVAKIGKQINIVIVSVGNDRASQIYINNKIKTCKEVGINIKHCQLDNDICQEECEQIIEAIANRSTVHGIMLQLPVPKHLDKDRLINKIPSKKDLDGLTDENMGKLINGKQDAIIPCTALGCYKVLESIYGSDLSYKNVTIINRSGLIGRPLSVVLTQHNATVTLCHSRSDLPKSVDNADIVVTGIGKPKFFNKDLFHDGQVILDCGMNKDENNKTCGDINIEDLLDLDVNISPVPKGIGQLTTSCLILNSIKCYLLQGGK